MERFKRPGESETDRATRQDSPSANLAGRLLGYLDTWWQDPGYGGVVVHSCWQTTNLHYTGPHTFSNAQMLLAFLRLHRRFGGSRWLQRAVQCGEVLVSLLKADGVYRNSTAESDPEEGCLIHNALPDVALLRLAEELRATDENKELVGLCSYATRKNIEWIIRSWWNGRRFCGTINQDLYACLAMVLWQKMHGGDRYSSYVSRTLDYVRSMVQKGGPLDGAIQRSEVEGGKVFGTIYQAGKALLLLELGTAMQDRSLTAIGRDVAGFVQRQQEADGRFRWGYREEDGRIVAKRLPLINSSAFVECGLAFKPHGASIDCGRYLPWICGQVPMRLASEGFAGSDRADWRNGIPSPDNPDLLSLLAVLAEQEPMKVTFDGRIMASGPDVEAGGEYVYFENRSGAFRIRSDGSPALDYVAAKKAEYPSVFPSAGGASFASFEDKGRTWKPDRIDCENGRARFTALPDGAAREFELSSDSLRITQAPCKGERISFELLARTSLSHSLVAEAGGSPRKIPFARTDGRAHTSVEDLGKELSIESWSPRLRTGNVTLRFSHPIRRLSVDHTRATAFGALCFWLEAAPCERLELEVKVGPVAPNEKTSDGARR